MISVLTVANTILEAAFRAGESVTPRQLQCLCILAERKYMLKTGLKLFKEEDAGIVREAFKGYGSRKIGRFYHDERDDVYVVNREDIAAYTSILSVWRKFKGTKESDLLDIALNDRTD